MKTKFISAFILLLIALNSCKNDVPILAEEKEIPVVYCVLNPQDSTNYLRINRSTQDVDNFENVEYTGNITATLKETWTNDLYVLDRTDSFTKEIAIIPFKAKHIFKTEEKILPRNNYELRVYLEEFDMMLTSQTNTLGYFTILEPHPEITRTIDFATDPFYTMQWSACPGAFIYQIYVHFFYDEIYQDDTIAKKVIYKNLHILANGNIENFIYNNNIYAEPFMVFLGKALEINKDVTRKTKGVLFEIMAGNEHLATFLDNINMDISLSNMGLASNIKNGLGIFCSAYSEYTDTLCLSGNTIDSISFGQHTKELNFLDRWGNIH